ncbi:MAG TPA: amidohydrolase family protein [Acidimicrobiales bacterium]
MTAFDVVIRGGNVVDGTGAPARTADVAIAAGVVVEVGKVDGAGHREVDADGALVIPGFVDIHTHYDGQATWDTSLAPSSWHGVTTVVMGNCGVGFAPVRASDHDKLIELMEGVEDIPGTALHEGLSWEWRTFAEYLDAVAKVPHDIDVAAQVPHGALRLHVMGERGANREPANADDIAAMAELARQAVEAGALGFTTSRTMNHRTSKGEYTPTLTAEADELVGIAEALGAAGMGVLQVVSDYLDVDREFDIFRRMAERSGRPLSTSLVAIPFAPDQYRKVLDLIDEANRDGVAMRAQVAARAVGVLNGLQCTWNPLRMSAHWADVADLPLEAKVRALRDPAMRERMLGGIDRDRRPFALLFELGDPPNYEPDVADAVGAQAARAGRDPYDLVYDLLLDDGGRALLYQPILNYVDGSLDAARELIDHEHTVPGLSDGGAHVGTICDGSFPTTLLSWWGRDRPSGRFGLPYLVRQQCRDTAATVGLLDRGVLAPGYRGDLNVIDFDRLGLRRPEMHFDLPAGGKRLLQRADGYAHTFVAGVETYRDGEATGELPGKLVRGARPAP